MQSDRDEHDYVPTWEDVEIEARRKVKADDLLDELTGHLDTLDALLRDACEDDSDPREVGALVLQVRDRLAREAIARHHGPGRWLVPLRAVRVPS